LQPFNPARRSRSGTTATYHGHLPRLCSDRRQAVLDGLLPNIRQALTGALKETTAYCYAMAKQEDDEALEAHHCESRHQ
jgi:TRAP-type C4-dicarboxylate transport system substrate-binding protein